MTLQDRGHGLLGQRAALLPTGWETNLAVLSTPCTRGPEAAEQCLSRDFGMRPGVLWKKRWA
jgi:hypothetical protein